jgi:hypothetical protein
MQRKFYRDWKNQNQIIGKTLVPPILLTYYENG